MQIDIRQQGGQGEPCIIPIFRGRLIRSFTRLPTVGAASAATTRGAMIRAAASWRAVSIVVSHWQEVGEVHLVPSLSTSPCPFVPNHPFLSSSRIHQVPIHHLSTRADVRYKVQRLVCDVEVGYHVFNTVPYMMHCIFEMCAPMWAV